MNVPIKYVNVYFEDRAYGGPEEGGWWFDYAVPAEASDLFTGEGCPGARFYPASQRHVSWRQVLAEARRVCDDLNTQRNDDTGSVCSEGRYIAVAEDHPPVGWPTERPYYC